jgi:peptide/nickel transport system substrate-binding protein
MLKLCRWAAAGWLLAGLIGIAPAFSQKSGGILQMPGGNSPASMSIHEESTIAVGIPIMGVFNNLVVFDQHVAQNSLNSIVPDLATGWSWSEDATQLTFPLRQGVKWHDGKPFAARDVKCTWDVLLECSADKFRINPRKSWYRNAAEITTNGDYEVTFHLKRPQPYLSALLASGLSSTASSIRSTPRPGSHASCARTTRSVPRSVKAGSTSPTRNSTKPMCAAPTATTPAIATRKPTS